jgi:hypothetical protein
MKVPAIRVRAGMGGRAGTFPENGPTIAKFARECAGLRDECVALLVRVAKHEPRSGHGLHLVLARRSRPAPTTVPSTLQQHLQELLDGPWTSIGRMGPPGGGEGRPASTTIQLLPVAIKSINRTIPPTRTKKTTRARPGSAVGFRAAACCAER